MSADRPMATPLMNDAPMGDRRAHAHTTSSASSTSSAPAAAVPTGRGRMSVHDAQPLPPSVLLRLRRLMYEIRLQLTTAAVAAPNAERGWVALTARVDGLAADLSGVSMLETADGAAAVRHVARDLRAATLAITPSATMPGDAHTAWIVSTPIDTPVTRVRQTLLVALLRLATMLDPREPVPVRHAVRSSYRMSAIS